MLLMLRWVYIIEIVMRKVIKVNNSYPMSIRSVVLFRVLLLIVESVPPSLFAYSR